MRYRIGLRYSTERFHDFRLTVVDPLGDLAVGSDTAILNVAKNIAPQPGYFDVVVHGAPYDANGAIFMVDGQPTNAAQIAEAIKSNPNWSGQPVWLITCYGACGPAAPAQDIANILGVSVEGVTGPVGVPRIPNSAPSVGNNGILTTFNPTKKSGL
ncbi:hypothetical protein [Collimonas humicola]|uniref:hypothetical protein n=1 Tax=Collimonas humicola TaxID=2825886 RepID=UPI001B8C7454|nr:hypothetical protein [Collimonas humicola]